MDFSEAQIRVSGLAGRRKRNEIDDRQYAEAVNNIRVLDESGRWWQPSPYGTGWLCWDGKSWIAATPPALAAVSAAPSPLKQQSVGEFRAGLMDTKTFMEMSKTVPLNKRPRKWWDLLSILGGIAVAVIWFFYATIRSGQEGFDLVTPVLMILIPLALIFFRDRLDEMLIPLQPTRQQIPKLARIGLGLAIPFLTAFILYNIFDIRQYPLMWANLVIGTLACYALLRDPSPRVAKKQRAKIPAVLILCIVLLLSVCITPVLADDCTRDPLNAQDCLRTGGFAELIAGLFAALLGGLINLPAILQILTGGGGYDDKAGDDNPEDDEDEPFSLRLTYPAGYSPKVFTHGWVFGASARLGDKDLSESVKWTGTGSFFPDTGPRSRPSFAAPGTNQIVLSVETKKGTRIESFSVEAVSPAGYAHVNSTARCDADAHGCPACPHPVVGEIITGSPLVFVNGLPAARVGDSGIHRACCGPNTFTVASGNPEVVIDGRPAARIGDTTRHCGGTGSIVG